jgi:hypothetical protein
MIFTGECFIDHAAVKETELPAEWQAALKDRVSSPEAFAGSYQNIGERRTRWMNKPGEGPRSMRAFLWHPSNEDPRRPQPGRTVELIVFGPTQLKFIAREGNQVLNEDIRDVQWDASSRSFAYAKDQQGGVGLGGHGAPGAALEWTSRHLYKGKDGCLYEQWSTGTAGLGLFVFPVSTTSGDWSQWKPVAAPKAPSGP